METLIKKFGLTKTDMFTGRSFINNVFIYKFRDELFFIDGTLEGDPFPKNDKVTILRIKEQKSKWAVAPKEFLESFEPAQVEAHINTFLNSFAD